MTRTVLFNGSELTYELTRKKVKNINLRVHPDGKIIVSAGKRVSEKYIDSFVSEKAPFILKALEKAKSEEKVRPTAFSSGESFYHNGEKRILTFVSGKKNLSEIKNGELVLTCRCYTEQERKRAFEKWEREEAEKVALPFISKALKDFERYGVSNVKIHFRRMKSRWGSCTPAKSEITLNVYLAEVPPECAEYVVYHEFTHFLEANHSNAFYSKLSEYIPDWKERREKMKKYCAVGR